jgi:hypothetical protein
VAKVEKVGLRQILEGREGLNIPPGAVKSLVSRKGKASLYGVWAASWDLRVPDSPRTTTQGHLKFKDARQKKQWVVATAVRVHVWSRLKHFYRAQQHHQSFWLFPGGLRTGGEEGEDAAQARSRHSLDGVLQLFRDADTKLRTEGLVGTRFSVFPLVSTLQLMEDVEQSFRGNITDDLGRLTDSYDKLNAEHGDIESIDADEWDARPPSLKPFDSKAKALNEVARKAKRLTQKLRTYIHNMAENSGAMDRMTDAEKKAVTDQVESLKKNLPVISGVEV